jgi:hypothetical protein
VLEKLDQLVEPLKLTCTSMVKANSVKQEYKKQDALKRSAMRAVAALLNIRSSRSLPPGLSPRLSWPTYLRASRRTAGTPWATRCTSAEEVAAVMQVCFLLGSEVIPNLSVIRLSPTSYIT